jgi:hypothetical protein
MTHILPSLGTYSIEEIENYVHTSVLPEDQKKALLERIEAEENSSPDYEFNFSSELCHDLLPIIANHRLRLQEVARESTQRADAYEKEAEEQVQLEAEEQDTINRLHEHVRGEGEKLLREMNNREEAKAEAKTPEQIQTLYDMLQKPSDN